jgi:small-conductance mechanosensitive channel
MVEQPIRIGDYIEINDMVGRVINIGARCINLRTSSNIDILVPNSVMLQNTVVNWTLNDTSIRISSIIPISNEAPSRLVEEILLQVLNQNSDILKDPKPQAFFSSFAEGNAVKFEILFWIDLAAMAERKKILSDINHALTAILRDHNISLALNWKEGDRFK